MPIKAYIMNKSYKYTEITTAQNCSSHLRMNFFSIDMYKVFFFYFILSIFEKHDFSLAKKSFEAVQIAFEVKIEKSFHIHTPILPSPS